MNGPEMRNEAKLIDAFSNDGKPLRLHQTQSVSSNQIPSSQKVLECACDLR